MSNTYENHQEMRTEFETALGGMISSFASAEGELVSLLGKLSGLTPPIANALLSGAKADQGCSLIRRIYRAKQTEIPKALDNALSQFKTISTDRNLVIHHGSFTSAAHGQVSSNYRIVLPDAPAREISVSPKQLNAMKTDLSGIVLVFDFHKPGTKIDPKEAYDQVMLHAVKFAQGGAWLYKSIPV